MALLLTGLWQLAVAVIIFFNISSALPSVERHQRQVELKLMHDAGMTREYEKTVKLLEEMLNYKRSVPNTSETKDRSDFIDKNNDSWSSEEKLIKLKTCLQFVQNLDARHKEKVEGGQDKEVKPQPVQFIGGCNIETTPVGIMEVEQQTTGHWDCGCLESPGLAATLDRRPVFQECQPVDFIYFHMCFSDDSFPGSDAKDASPVISRSICRLIVELNEAASGAPAEEIPE
ncbi:hypothetical protein lerEdw1_005244 [Lerista edwardsae]|nr:hypothetical protein lerEdw1_005244 [Lerista edwardsae]